MSLSSRLNPTEKCNAPLSPHNPLSLSIEEPVHRAYRDDMGFICGTNPHEHDRRLRPSDLPESEQLIRQTTCSILSGAQSWIQEREREKNN
jgi:hypothetical protein